ncbi:MAG: sigma-70 family RNA polymerase sigma factor [Planctomycetaceae bacterium]
MGHYNTDTISELANQQMRFAPQAVRHRQIAGAEALLDQVDGAKAYNFADICKRLTGYRPERTDTGQIAGTDLIHDLRCFIEDLSESLKLESNDFSEPLLTVREVSEKLNVSAKTVDRWRNRGLASRRVLVGGRRRVVIPQSTLDRFVETHRDEVDRSQNFRQLSDEERERIIFLARQLASEGLGLTDVSRRVAQRFDRATETIRYTLRDFDSKNPQNAIFPTNGTRLSTSHENLAYDLYSAGIPLTDLARRFGRPKSMIQAVIADVRARRIKSLDIDFIDSEEFRLPDADRIIRTTAPEYDEPDSTARVPTDLPAYLAELYNVPLLNKAQEQHYFRLMNYLKFKASNLQQDLDLKQPKGRPVAEIEAILKEVAEVKSLLIRSNLRLVVSIAKRHLKPGANFFELVSDGNMSLIRAIEKFDYFRGNKFSTYASWAIMKNFARSVPAESTRLDRFRTGFDELFHESDDARGNPFAAEMVNTAQRTAIQEIMKELSGREQKVIACRFGLDYGTEPETLEQVGNRLGVTKERVRQIEVRTLEKLRRIARRRRVDIPGI